MKKTLSMLLASTMIFGMMAGCSSSGGDSGTSTPGTSTPDAGTSTPSAGTPDAGSNVTPSENPVELLVMTSYGGDDGNRQNYENAYKAFEAASGHSVVDTSETSSEAWKAKVMTDFQTGAEPDVLFYFAGADADTLIEEGKVISVADIQAEFPDYASNMKADMLPASPYDGEQYCVPVNGFWEGLFVNKAVLEAAGVEVPGADYDWDAFLVDCQTILDEGFTPIAASLQAEPHYIFEFAVLNNGNVDNHSYLPVSTTEDVGMKWAAGLNDIKDLYDSNYFQSNTLTNDHLEAVQLFLDGEAAFLIDGSWRLNGILENAMDPDEFTVTYVPGKGEREATEVVAGLSMGYYITEKAWADPDTRAAAVEFVMAMTTDEVVSQFGATSITALKNGTTIPDSVTQLEEDAIAMTAGATFAVMAVQDSVEKEPRTKLFDGVKDVVTGGQTAEDLLKDSLGIS